MMEFTENLTGVYEPYRDGMKLLIQMHELQQAFFTIELKQKFTGLE